MKLLIKTRPNQIFLPKKASLLLILKTSDLTSFFGKYIPKTFSPVGDWRLFDNDPRRSIPLVVAESLEVEGLS